MPLRDPLDSLRQFLGVDRTATPADLRRAMVARVNQGGLLMADADETRRTEHRLVVEAYGVLSGAGAPDRRQLFRLVDEILAFQGFDPAVAMAANPVLPPKSFWQRRRQHEDLAGRYTRDRYRVSPQDLARQRRTSATATLVVEPGMAMADCDVGKAAVVVGDGVMLRGVRCGDLLVREGGAVLGDVQCATLVISGGVVAGTVLAERCVVDGGEIHGDIDCQRFEQRDGFILGNVAARASFAQQGGSISGHVTRPATV